MAEIFLILTASSPFAILLAFNLASQKLECVLELAKCV
jgi:hypothetical protein